MLQSLVSMRIIAGRARRFPARRGRWRAFLIILLVALIPAAYLFGKSQAPEVPEGAADEFALYLEAWEAVREDYVDRSRLDPREQTYGAIRGMLESLGDEGHTRFLTPEEARANRDELAGEYVGVGIQVEDRDGRVVVSAPIDGSPADEAGIRPGDVIVAVDGRSVRDMELNRVVELIRGPEDTGLRLTVERGGREFTFPLDRTEIRVPAASWLMIPGTDAAVLRLAAFSAGAADEVERVMEEAEEAGAGRFILDLRNNPGGRVDQVPGIAGQFLEPGQVVYIRKDADGREHEVSVPRRAEPTRAPVVVLVNEGTASSAEILAGALQSHGRAKVVGETTFGTGTVLNEFVLEDGSAILLGVAEWLTPDGRFIREDGIEPDVRAELPEEVRPLTPDESRNLSREQMLDRDPQLGRAFEVLQSGS
ncbi:S41 family peptidase [Rubrobacter taiwanensis]|jgi:carboxyl-terminal processing protease|uniref:S41 family peptidase n=2 Tax=Rubrobacter taiwanensis TaxID=185139 RepID=A0A4R1BEQ5_9ACTN|nr:S41 family peptidase [Rubrobacter taiwanensis]